MLFVTTIDMVMYNLVSCYPLHMCTVPPVPLMTSAKYIKKNLISCNAFVAELELNMQQKRNCIINC